MVAVKKCLALLLIGVLVFSVISSGCISETKTVTPEKSGSPTLSSSTTTQEKNEVVLRLIGPNGEEKALTLEDIKKLPQFEGKGGLKTKRGSIKKVGTYKGVLLSDLLKLVNGLSPDYNIIITAADATGSRRSES
ncbi:hypothetical protein E3E31_00735 [Thermococcus sp. M39]|uniref:hypothetical protein n=1 Tax=unclassified Thermococcus TaxID=2627626 RepID=UPI001439D90D|nr:MULTISPECIES: hypothetical protein [unclassified Thermococcus]NJE07080.1 hypothetical protein [Thermococcus sp. M39]NJE13618.1 hypothetical protein [Thermococcus sp. LS2]